MKRINLYWYKHKGGHGNFGDELNPYIFEKLTETKFKHVDVEYLDKDKFLIFKILIRHFFIGKISFTFFLKYLYYNFINTPQITLSIGSVLQFCKINNAIVWGAGILSSDSRLPNAKYYAVRGYKTKEKIKELGYEVPNIVGDPAILLPLIYKPKNEKKYNISIIPHYIHYNEYKEKLESKYNVINLLDNIERVIDEIYQSHFIISTSLHGIIVAHAYGIKSVRVEDSKRKLSGDDIKFLDYFSSIHLKNYNPIMSQELFNKSEEELVNIINEDYNEVILPKQDIIKEIQYNLLEVFPYKLKI